MISRVSLNWCISMINRFGWPAQNFSSIMPFFLASLLMQSSLSPILHSKTWYFFEKNPQQLQIIYQDRPADGAADSVGGDASCHVASILVHGGQIDLVKQRMLQKCCGRYDFNYQSKTGEKTESSRLVAKTILRHKCVEYMYLEWGVISRGQDFVGGTALPANVIWKYLREGPKHRTL